MGGTPDIAWLRQRGQDQGPGKTRPPPPGNDGLPQEEQAGHRHRDHGAGGGVDQLV